MMLFLLILVISIIFAGVYYMLHSSINHIITIRSRNSATSVERCKRVTFFSHQSWINSIIGIAMLFLLHISLSLVVRLKSWRRTRRVWIHPVNSRGPSGLSRWVDRVFVAIAVSCAALGLLAQVPGSQSPVWLGLTLQGFIYGSAFIFYTASGGQNPEYSTS